MNDLGMVVINHNQPKLTDDLLEDLKLQDSSFSLTVIDNGSDTPYLNATERNPKNEDLNRIWNAFHTINGSKYQCFLNNDVRITKNFVSDTIKILDKEPSVGAVIHITNNSEFLKATELNYTVLEKPTYQGWDFTIRTELFKPIPDELRLFGGDDWLFAWIIKQGFKVALVYSSPIIHYANSTTKTVKGVSILQTQYDAPYWYALAKKYDLQRMNPTWMNNIGFKVPPLDMVLEGMTIVDKESLDLYNEICSKLELNTPFALTRWGDGEWIAVNQGKGSNCDKCYYYPELGIALKNIVTTKQNYYMCGLRNASNQLLTETSKYKQKWYPVDLFYHTSTTIGINKFIEILKTKHVVYVGNKDLKTLSFIKEFISIPSSNAWNFKDTILSSIRNTLNNEHKVYLFSAGMASNVFIHELWKNNNQNTYIDVGSIFDPYVGKTTRSYHKNMLIKEL